MIGDSQSETHFSSISESGLTTGKDRLNANEGIHTCYCTNPNYIVSFSIWLGPLLINDLHEATSKMRFNVPIAQSSQAGYTDRSNRNVVKESSPGKSVGRVSVTPKHTNKKEVSMKEEERQDESIGAEETQQQILDDMEYQILYNEIESISQRFQSGSSESEEKITLTSAFSNEAEISKTMHVKLMRLIKAMIPNSTTEQKDTFIRDLFGMGLRVSKKSSTRSQFEENTSIGKYDDASYDHLMIEESNSILESENDSPEMDKGSVQQKHTEENYICNPYLDQGLQNTPSLDEYVDGANSILASMDESDTPGVEMATALQQSVSSRRLVASQTTNSSDAVDARWEQLRDKMLNGSESGRTGNSLTSEMEANLIQECVETGLSSYRASRTLNSKQQQTQVNGNEVPVPQEDMTPVPYELQAAISDGFSIGQVTDHVKEEKTEECPQHTEITTPNVRKRPGQADESSIHQPVQQRNIASDTFSIDAETSNIPSFDEGTVYEDVKIAFEGTNSVASQKKIASQESKGNEGETEMEEKFSCDESHQISRTVSFKEEPRIRVSGSNDMHNSKIKEENHVGESDAETQIQSMDDSSRDMAKLIHVKSSLTAGTDFLSPRKGPDRSFFQSVNLSASGETEWPNSPTSALPSWRLNPAESLSDFMLTVLSVETGTATNFYVHKHMMAIGPRSSKYMGDVFTSEDASNFQVTLDEKTSALIPEILDYIYCPGHDVTMTTDNAVAVRQLAKMLKINPLEVQAAEFILEDMEVDNMVTYVSECNYFNDTEVMKAVVEKCTGNIESIPIDDRLWIVMEPELFLQILSSPHINRGVLSKHLSILLKEYLDLHQYEISADMFVTLTSESIIPIVDRTAALPLIELSDGYESTDCEEIQKRCAFTLACYWQTTPQTERHRLFALLRNLPSSLTVDFLEIVESGHNAMEMLRSEMEQQTIDGNQYAGEQQEALTVQDFCGDLTEEDQQNETLSWRMDPEKSYSDMSIRVEYLNHEGSQIYHVHKQIIAVGPHRSKFFAEHLNSTEVAPGENVCIAIKLDYEGSSVVPQVLDYMYSQNTALEISNENSVAFHYVSRAFEIPTLGKEIMKFIDEDLSLENVADYIIDGGYYRDHLTIATAGRLCAQKIMSIDVDSNLLTELEPDFFEKVVSCDTIEQSAQSHVNILITKYFLVHDLEGDVVERLFESIRIDQIEKNSALTMLKMLITLKDYEGVEFFERMKEKCIDVITKNWTELTADNQRREEVFSILPSFPSHVVASMFDTVERNSREEQMETVSQQAILSTLYQEQVAEANRLREVEVSSLRKELEEQTVTMLALQKELEGKLMKVDRTLLRRRTGRSAASIMGPPSCQRKTDRLSEIREMVTAATASTDEGGGSPTTPTQETTEGAPWYHQGVVNEQGMMDMLGMETIADVLVEHSKSINTNNKGREQQEEMSVSTIHVQKKKGRMCC